MNKIVGIVLYAISASLTIFGIVRLAKISKEIKDTAYMAEFEQIRRNPLYWYL